MPKSKVSKKMRKLQYRKTSRQERLAWIAKKQVPINRHQEGGYDG